ncbi:unnamed protein product [Phaedon cochleariae]|uniref:Ribosomal protein L1 n=1 Tax=Phaedon cochleariae TaxID=80249 RepID=A0A9P0GSM6_PHACE|nr:unnamed protein product [Phaedon cochleariae]
MAKIPKHLGKPRKSLTKKSPTSTITPLKSPKGIKKTPQKSVQKNRKKEFTAKNLDEYEDSSDNLKKRSSRSKKTGGNLIDNETGKSKNDSKRVVSSTKRDRSTSNDAIYFQQIVQSSVKNVLEKYEISLTDIKSAIEGVIKFHSENPKIKNQLFNERFPISITVNCTKIPRGHPKLYRVPLKNSLLTDSDDICLIASEVKGIGNKEHDKHVEHYEDLLAAKGVTNIKKIMTFHELRTEHETFEQKSRLVDLYDMFLVCGKISGKVVKKCGKIFYKKRKVPIPVKLQASKLKSHIDQSLSKSFFHLHLKGDSYNLQFGHSEMDTMKIMENFLSVIEFLDKNFPGGFDNIKGLFVYAPRSTSIPVFVSTKSAKEIGKVSTNTSKNPVKTCRGELTTLPDAEVIVKPSGQVFVKRTIARKIETSDEKITDEDIIQANKEDSENRDIVTKKNTKVKGTTSDSKVAKKRKPSKEISEDVKRKTKKQKINTDQGGKKAFKSKDDKKKKRKAGPIQ